MDRELGQTKLDSNLRTIKLRQRKLTLGDNWCGTRGIAGNHGDPEYEIQDKLDDDQESPDHHNVSDA